MPHLNAQTNNTIKNCMDMFDSSLERNGLNMKEKDIFNILDNLNDKMKAYKDGGKCPIAMIELKEEKDNFMRFYFSKEFMKENNVDYLGVDYIDFPLEFKSNSNHINDFPFILGTEKGDILCGFEYVRQQDLLSLAHLSYIFDGLADVLEETNINENHNDANVVEAFKRGSRGVGREFVTGAVCTLDVKVFKEGYTESDLQPRYKPIYAMIVDFYDRHKSDLAIIDKDDKAVYPQSPIEFIDRLVDCELHHNELYSSEARAVNDIILNDMYMEEILGDTGYRQKRLDILATLDDTARKAVSKEYQQSYFRGLESNR